MNGVLYWNKRRLDHFWWNSFRKHGGGGGNLYYRIPYKLNLNNIWYLNELDLKNLRGIVETLFKRNPDFKGCDVEIGSINNAQCTSAEWITAIVVTKDRKFYDRYTAEREAIRNML